MKAAKAFGQVELDGTPDLDGRVVAAVLGNVGRYDEAMKVLRANLEQSPWTRVGLSREPKLLRLRGNPQFEAFLKERDPK
jgi:hypothetical protein